MAWTENGEFFHVGDRIAPAGTPAARAAVHAKRFGNTAALLHYARLAMEADRAANEARAAGELLRRSNVVGNAWSGWYSGDHGPAERLVTAPGQAVAPDAVLAALRTAAAEEFDKPIAAQAWTTSTLRALAALAPPGACVDPDVSAARVGKGRAAKEFLWDLTISEWPHYKRVPYRFPDYFQEAREPRLLLVAESEWGAARGRKKNGFAVMDDFCKLLSARAPLKVMVFGYFVAGESSFEQLRGLMADLILRSKDDAAYVLFGVAWDSVREWKGCLVTAQGTGAITVGP